MDYNELERERGITILAKCTTIDYNGFRINLVDTPGHADFGGEVERAMALVDGMILVVDGTEGPMVQTKVVLGLGLKRAFTPIVVFNKLDRETARLDAVDSEVLDLFASLGAKDDQLAYPSIYASAKKNWASRDPGKKEPGMHALFQAIIEHIPPPPNPKTTLSTTDYNVERQPFGMLIAGFDKSGHLGRACFGRVASGVVRLGDTCKVFNQTNPAIEHPRINQMFIRKGSSKILITEAIAGDICSVVGPSTATSLNDTIGSRDLPEPLEPFSVQPPTVSMLFGINDGPLKGTEGKPLTARSLHDRIAQEVAGNPSMSVRKVTTSASLINGRTGEEGQKEVFEVMGRGEMQLCILAENMRREGWELSVSMPTVLVQKRLTAEGQWIEVEPIVEVVLEAPSQYTGFILDSMSNGGRNASMTSQSDLPGKNGGEAVRFSFELPMRFFIGYGGEFRSGTRGEGILSFEVIDHRPLGSNNNCSNSNPFTGNKRGPVMISTTSGTCTKYALSELEDKGTLFVQPGDPVYEGMIIGEVSCAASTASGRAPTPDLEVNPCRLKEQSNYRAASKDDFTRLREARAFALEDLIAFAQEDELVELTPKSMRLRKKELSSIERKRQAKHLRNKQQPQAS